MIFALAGNQNCGKTTLFNQLTGSNQHVGNFPGVTVDQKSGAIRGQKDCTVVDLPGIYSIRPYTPEEIVTRDFIINQKPDGIINIVDATNIERNLYLTLQLLEMRIPMVLANEIAAMTLPPLLVMIVIILALCFLGCFIPAIPLVLICVPIFVPIAKVFGWDLIWFGVIIVILDNMASITPPFGINLFVMKEVASVSLGTMYRAAIPFVIALLLCLGIIIAFPPLSTLIPALMKG